MIFEFLRDGGRSTTQWHVNFHVNHFSVCLLALFDFWHATSMMFLKRWFRNLFSAFYYYVLALLMTCLINYLLAFLLKFVSLHAIRSQCVMSSNFNYLLESSDRNILGKVKKPYAISTLLIQMILACYIFWVFNHQLKLNLSLNFWLI